MKPSCFSKTQRAVRHPRHAFTLLEIMVVLALIGLLAGLAINHLVHATDRANAQVASIWTNATIKTPLMMYKLQQYRFPSTEEGLAALVAPPGTARDTWRGPYLDSPTLPLDPWGEPYQYACPGANNPDGYDVWSKGPDRINGTADDIGNWRPKPQT